MSDSAFAIVNAQVVPMDREGALHDHGVVVRGDRIVAVAPSSELPVPADALTIDAGGKTLLPGLGTIHVHSNVMSEIAPKSRILALPILHPTWLIALQGAAFLKPPIMRPLAERDPAPARS